MENMIKIVPCCDECGGCLDLSLNDEPFYCDCPAILNTLTLAEIENQYIRGLITDSERLRLLNGNA